MADRFPRVVGYCPMGCGETLMLADGGHVTCTYLECPDPCAVDTLLDDRETEHVVTFGGPTEHFTIRHPLRERVGDELLECDLHQWITALDGPPAMPGRYRVRKDGDGRYTFESLPDVEVERA
jgi:hypothetical protein